MLNNDTIGTISKIVQLILKFMVVDSEISEIFTFLYKYINKYFETRIFNTISTKLSMSQVSFNITSSVFSELLIYPLTIIQKVLDSKYSLILSLLCNVKLLYSKDTLDNFIKSPSSIIVFILRLILVVVYVKYIKDTKYLLKTIILNTILTLVYNIYLHQGTSMDITLIDILLQMLIPVLILHKKSIVTKYILGKNTIRDQISPYNNRIINLIFISLYGSVYTLSNPNNKMFYETIKNKTSIEETPNLYFKYLKYMHNQGNDYISKYFSPEPIIVLFKNITAVSTIHQQSVEEKTIWEKFIYSNNTLVSELSILFMFCELLYMIIKSFQNKRSGLIYQLLTNIVINFYTSKPIHQPEKSIETNLIELKYKAFVVNPLYKYFVQLFSNLSILMIDLSSPLF